MKIWLLVIIPLAASCQVSKTGDSENSARVETRQIFDERISDERIKAASAIMEVQRMFFLCNLLMPDDKNFSDETYKHSPLYSFEQLVPVESNPYVSVLRDPQVFSEAYGDRQGESFQLAIRDCRETFPVEMKKLEANKEKYTLLISSQGL